MYLVGPPQRYLGPCAMSDRCGLHLDLLAFRPRRQVFDPVRAVSEPSKLAWDNTVLTKVLSVPALKKESPTIR